MSKDFFDDMEFEHTNGIFLVGSMIQTHKSDMLSFNLEKLAKDIMLKDMVTNMPSYMYPCERTRPEVEFSDEDTGKKRNFFLMTAFSKMMTALE